MFNALNFNIIKFEKKFSNLDLNYNLIEILKLSYNIELH